MARRDTTILDLAETHRDMAAKKRAYAAARASGKMSKDAELGVQRVRPPSFRSHAHAHAQQTRFFLGGGGGGGCCKWVTLMLLHVEQGEQKVDQAEQKLSTVTTMLKAEMHEYNRLRSLNLCSMLVDKARAEVRNCKEVRCGPSCCARLYVGMLTGCTLGVGAVVLWRYLFQRNTRWQELLGNITRDESLFAQCRHRISGHTLVDREREAAEREEAARETLDPNAFL